MGRIGRGWTRWWGACNQAVRRVLQPHPVVVGSLLAAGLAATPLHAEQVAPAHWVAYAHKAGAMLQSRLSDDASEQGTRLYTQLAQRSDGQTPQPLLVQLWIDGQGRVERSTFDSLGETQADAALRAVLATTPLPAPPADMRQPLVLRLTLQPKTDIAGQVP